MTPKKSNQRQNDGGSFIQKSVFFTESKVADGGGAKQKEQKEIPNLYLFLSEKEQGDILKKKLEERQRKQAAEREKEMRNYETVDAGGHKTTKKKYGESGFSMVVTDISRILGRGKKQQETAVPAKNRQEAMRKRTAAKYLKLILTGERNEPELCPRIFAILLIWLIIVIIILGIVYFQTRWLDPLKVLMGSEKKNKDAFCFAEMTLVRIPSDNDSIISG